MRRTGRQRQFGSGMRVAITVHGAGKSPFAPRKRRYLRGAKGGMSFPVCHLSRFGRRPQRTKRFAMPWLDKGFFVAPNGRSRAAMLTCGDKGTGF